jgi:hypothetical protein
MEAINNSKFELLVDEAVVVGMSLQQQKWIRKAMVMAYNLALDAAAESAHLDYNNEQGQAWDIDDFKVNKQSILNLKLI